MSVDVDGLRRDAEILRAVAAVLRAHLLVQQQAVVRLSAAWSGEAADLALAALRRQLARARADCVAVEAVAGTLDGAADLIRDARSERDAHVERVEARQVSSPGPAAPHALACLVALADLFDVVDRVVDGARMVVERAVAALGVEAVPPELDAVAAEPAVVLEPAVVPEPAVPPEPAVLPAPAPASAPLPSVDVGSGAELADAGPL